ncbi:hypothetical protein [Desulfopila aestuarii]|uniref:Uncharacterized protein n=1 Tax=Desulfopila aestuarii DSM 18488 TaxID=1121416 RepID=A0A1M7YIN6_9BACT|nr:hypothetical protein [Desulfopila aestuarii]SHO52470.1 hypothetical protein SAMN02745220_04579 [Desulfopila aestuarii DSM 18488]
MKPTRTIVLAIACCLCFINSTSVLAKGKAPLEVGGFVLGSDVGDYPDAMNTNFLKEMVITDWHGFRKGVISYGICKYPNKIVRIELKYEDQTKEYFLKLLSEYKKQFGAPDEWKGDSFGILHIWKWYFKDSANRTISLLLQHNLRNPNESIGNVVKLSYTDMMEEERECFNQMCEEKKSDKDRERLEQLKKPDWQFLIPR